eukprot:CAMPEP_0172458468 /NCGR_PEP_ID=MMETSP1065-20121228/27676_1 /TAXON_ID=265537 /ORGANISM="Amphiprora paludosa, Strain CCMP125" /LENGTH=152 /DNA_ID=CAMNT_0013212737 /DNA_START=119 /DNA_END=577 /DNA_ORIENTATION=-
MNATISMSSSVSSINELTTFYPWLRILPQKSSLIEGNETFFFVLILSEFASTNTSSHPTLLFEPLFKILPSGDSAVSERSQINNDIAPHSILDYYTNDLVGLVSTPDKRRHSSSLDADDESTLSTADIKLDVAPGMDPVLMLCIATCLFEML